MHVKAFLAKEKESAYFRIYWEWSAAEKLKPEDLQHYCVTLIRLLALPPVILAS